MEMIPILSLDKPKFGQPCNNCGLCCLVHVCDLGQALGDKEVCKALMTIEGGGYVCGLVEAPYQFLPDEVTAAFKAMDELEPGEDIGLKQLQSIHAEALGAGRGCDTVEIEQLDEEDQRVVAAFRSTT
ncbi:hypothetical protein ACYPKM_05310 [Pseudomonas aeruginosa]